jgi:hypothetical protein
MVNLCCFDIDCYSVAMQSIGSTIFKKSDKYCSGCVLHFFHCKESLIEGDDCKLPLVRHHSTISISISTIAMERCVSMDLRCI